MSPPIRETPENRENQRRAIADLREAWRCKTVTHPTLSRWDFDAYSPEGGHLIAHGEVKCRKNLCCAAFGRYGALRGQGVWLETAKYDALIHQHNFTGAAPVFVVWFMGCNCLRTIDIRHPSVDRSKSRVVRRNEMRDEYDEDEVLDVYPDKMLSVRVGNFETCPPAPCYACGSDEYWRGQGAWICSTCHPPAREGEKP